MVAKGWNVAVIFAATAVLLVGAVFLGAGSFWLGGFIFALVMVFVVAVELLILRFTRPHVLRRRLDNVNWWDRVLAPIIALCPVASAALSAYDVAHSISVLPSWAFLLGVVLLFSAYMVMAQSLVALPPHGADKYGEEPGDERERGPYETVRHPVMLAVLLGGLSVPLFLSSGLGFIPIGVMILAIIARVYQEDNWRFQYYEWFFDYTKEVSYRLIPFLW